MPRLKRSDRVYLPRFYGLPPTATANVRRADRKRD